MIYPDVSSLKAGVVSLETLSVLMAKSGESFACRHKLRLKDPLERKPGECLWLEWFDEAFWLETRAAQNDVRNWSSLYQQRPQPEEGTFFQRDWFKRYRVGDEPARLSVYGASDYAVD